MEDTSKMPGTGNIILNNDYNEFYKIARNNAIKAHKILITPTKEDRLKVFNCINWDNGNSDITIECYNELFSYNIILDNMNKFIKLIENKRDSLDDTQNGPVPGMFYEFHREINITVPKTIINLLLSDDKMLGYNLLKQYIKTII